MEIVADCQDYQLIKDKLSDRVWRLNNLYYIVDKKGRKVKFKLNWAQEKLLKNMWYFNVILKARQLGFTTFILIYFLDSCLFNSNHAAGVIAHTQDSAEDLFKNKVKFAYDNLPDWLKKLVKATEDSAKKLAFSNGSSFTVGVSLRSGTFQKLLISEYGKVSAKDPGKAKEIKTGALNTVEVGQQIFIESTAEGKSGEFYDICETSRKNEDDARPKTRLDPKFHFFAWFDNPEYALTDEESENVVISAEDEKYLRKFPHLTINQKAWYVVKKSTMKKDMKQEYPSTPNEAFEGSMEGAYFTKQMAQIRENGQITNVPYDSRYPVYTWWDIGQTRDMMAVWFFQYVEGRYNFIEYHESNAETTGSDGWDYYAKLLKETGYNFEKHVWPHDGNKRIQGKKVQTSKEIAEECGIRPIKVTKRTSNVHDDVTNFCRPILTKCYFDAKNCASGIIHLDNYKRRYDRINGMYLKEPEHNEASHCADGFRTFAMNVEKILKEKKQSDFDRPLGSRVKWKG